MIVHIAGPEVQVTSHLRQRCSWCGAVLLDYDLTRVMVASTPDAPSGPSTWPVGSLVAQDGNAWWTVDPETSDEDPAALKLPEGSCGLLPPEITGSE